MRKRGRKGKNREGREYELTWAQGDIGVTRRLHSRNVYCFLLQFKILLWNLAPADTATAGTAPLARQQMGMRATPDGMIYLFGGISVSGGAISPPFSHLGFSSLQSWLLEPKLCPNFLTLASLACIWPAGAMCPKFRDINNQSQHQTSFIWGFVRLRPCNCHLDGACNFGTSAPPSLLHGIRCNYKRHFLHLCGRRNW